MAKKNDDCCRKLSRISTDESLERVNDLCSEISHGKVEKKEKHPHRYGFDQVMSHTSGHDQVMSHNQKKKLRRKKGIDSVWFCNWCKCYFRDLTLHQFFNHVFMCSFPSMKKGRSTDIEKSGPIISRKREKQEEKGSKKNVEKGENKELVAWDAPSGIFAIDCDASVKERIGGSAFVIRDNLGYFVLAGVVARWRVSVVYHEMDAIKSGLYHGGRIGLNDDVVVRSDSRWAIDSILGQANPTPEVKRLLASVRRLQRSFVGRLSFKHVQREANRAADHLATTLTTELIEDLPKKAKNEPKKYPSRLPFEVIYQQPIDLPIQVFKILREDRSGKKIPRGEK